MNNENTAVNQRLAIAIRGAVQGVGFRPFVYRLASDMHLNGRVSNTSAGVFIEAEGSKDILDRFLLRLQREIPPRAFIQSLESSFLDPVGFDNFEILKSDDTGIKTSLIMPDIAVCTDCLKEIFDKSNRRYLYPFTNCTNCGPRFSIINALPYDRPNTSMKEFEMCPDCRAEYENPENRRFHAQPNACPKCGPQLQLWDANGKLTAEKHDSLLQAANAIESGKIVAVKGIGGFHLITDARSDESVNLLREKKHREEKPLALMFPYLEMIKQVCIVSEMEERLLLSPESPIVLIEQKNEIQNPQLKIAASAAPGNPYLGCILPYSPLHHILMNQLGFPVIATSGNLSDEPICTDEHEAVRRLKGIADLFLVHNRPIVRHVDDSIVRIILGRELVMRRARGYAPLPITIKTHNTAPLLAVGAHLKNTIAITSGSNVFISQHIGDLETKESLDAFHHVIDDFKSMYNCNPAGVVCDLHPDYLSSKYARTAGVPFTEVQHHHAHIASCMAENQIEGGVLGVSWDGTGFGLDGTIWGGEFLLADRALFERAASFRPFGLPGGEKAIKEPRRTALGMLYELYDDEIFERQEIPVLQAFTTEELELVKQMLVKKVNTPVTTSAGRIFDAVASLTGLRHKLNYEGQAAMELEFLAHGINIERHYPFTIEEMPSGKSIDWRAIIEEVLIDLKNDIGLPVISAKFHNTLVEIIVMVAKRIGRERIVLSGGCFQNRYLTERVVKRLLEEKFRPYWHQRVPPNDGGIALGQIAAAVGLQRQARLDD
ncbi:MAG: carbamoyltransferase HypF [Bacteroidetes bacterium]|nr:carbamoyltransferase HypF [Bacteroidota bacterium]